jgi:hypothetical protein
MKLEFKFTLRKYKYTNCKQCVYHKYHSGGHLFCHDIQIPETDPVFVTITDITQPDCAGFIPLARKL